MPRLNRNDVKNKVVGPALKAIASFEDDFEEFTFDHFHNFSMTIFLAKLKENILALGYDVLLNLEEAEKWNTFKDCIDYIKAEHFES